MRNEYSRQRARLIAPFAYVALAFAAAAAPAATVTVLDQHGAALANAVVTATTVSGTAGGPADATVAQVGQQFLPRVTVVPRGSRVHFPNRDTTQHHVYSFSEARQFEIELYKGDIPNPIEFDRAGIVALGCNIHDWMLGYIYVTDDDLYGVSDDNGTLQFDAAASDLATVTVWHPAATAGAPRTFDAASLARKDAAGLQLVIETRSEDPLAFEIDPLQMLFEGAAR